MDKSVKRFRPADEELSRVQDNLADAIQQLLDQQNLTASQQGVFAPIMQQLRGAGTPYSVKTPALVVKGRPDSVANDGSYTVIIGEPAATASSGVTTPQKDSNVGVFGKFTVTGPAGATDVITVIPQTAGQVMKITNIGNTQINFGVTSDGTCSSLGFVSGNGFKSFLDGGTFGSSGAAANTWAQHQRIVNKGGSFASQNLVQCMGFSGSVVGIMMQYQGNTTNNISIKVQKNNQDLWVYNNIYTGATNGALVCKTVPKGTYTFNPQDFLTVLSSYSTGTDVLLQVTLIIEQTA